MDRPTDTALQWRLIRRFLLGVALGNLLWEAAHVPLYTIWLTARPASILYAVLHCTAGDVLIAMVTLGLALACCGRKGWPAHRYRAVAITTILAALSYTIFSEWLNVEVRAAWAYRDLMPRLPVLGTGLTPMLQWIVVPAAAFWWARQGSAPKTTTTKTASGAK